MRQHIAAATFAAILAMTGTAFAGGGNMNPAGTNPQPDPQATPSGSSSYGTGEASRASSADTPAERMQKMESTGDAKSSKETGDGASEKKSQ